MKKKGKGVSYGKMPKEVIADIRIFDVLFELATERKISFTAWARAAWPEAKANQQPRISELKRISELVRNGLSQEEASDQVKRLCTLPKIVALEEGLMKLDVATTGKKTSRELLDKAERRGKGNEDYELRVTFYLLFGCLTRRSMKRTIRFMRKELQTP
jgi:hypothetical protein